MYSVQFLRARARGYNLFLFELESLNFVTLEPLLIETIFINRWHLGYVQFRHRTNILLTKICTGNGSLVLQMQGYNSDFMLLSLKQNARLLECHYFTYSSVNLMFAPSVPNVMAIVVYS